MKVLAREKNIAQITDSIESNLQMRKALSSAKLFSKLNLKSKELDSIATEIKIERFLGDEYIFKKGQKDDGHLYIILNGSVLVKPNKKSEVYFS